VDGVQFPWLGNTLIMAVVILTHVFFAFFAVGGSVLAVGAEWWGTKKQDQEYLRFSRSVSGFLSDMMKINGVLGVAIVVLSIGLWSQFSAFLYSVQFWPFLLEGAVFLFLMIFSVVYHHTWDSVSRTLHIFYGLCMAFFALAAGFLINGIWAFMLVPGKWIETQSRWDAFFNPILLESSIHILLPCLINAALILFIWTYWKSTKTQGPEQQYFKKMNKFTGVIGGSLLFLQPLSGIGFLFKVKSATESLPTPNPWSQIWLEGGLARPYLFTMIGLGTLAVIGAIIYWVQGHDKGRKALVAASLAMFVAFFMGAYTREKARKPYLVWGTMYMNQQFVGAKPALASVPADPNVAISGERVFVEQQCMSCHAFKGQGGSVGPDLSNLSQKFSREELIGFMKELPAPANMMMPPFYGSDQELEALVDYMLK
jgi:cytochrome bd-type quinol oxidase subunit 1